MAATLAAALAGEVLRKPARVGEVLRTTALVREAAAAVLTTTAGLGGASNPPTLATGAAIVAIVVVLLVGEVLRAVALVVEVPCPATPKRDAAVAAFMRVVGLAGVSDPPTLATEAAMVEITLVGEVLRAAALVGAVLRPPTLLREVTAAVLTTEGGLAVASCPPTLGCEATTTGAAVVFALLGEAPHPTVPDGAATEAAKAMVVFAGRPQLDRRSASAAGAAATTAVGPCIAASAVPRRAPVAKL